MSRITVALVRALEATPSPPAPRQKRSPSPFGSGESVSGEALPYLLQDCLHLLVERLVLALGCGKVDGLFGGSRGEEAAPDNQV